MKIILKKFKIDDIDCFALYSYDSLTRSAIYQYKGNKDLCLQDAFISPFKSFLKFKYYGYTICYPPSFKDKHNHYLFSSLNLNIEDLFIKTQNYKQSDHSFNERINIRKFIKFKKEPKNKKYLIVDDVLTSGNTIKTCVNLLKSKNIKKIKVLLISLNEYKEIYNKNEHKIEY